MKKVQGSGVFVLLMGLSLFLQAQTAAVAPAAPSASASRVNVLQPTLGTPVPTATFTRTPTASATLTFTSTSTNSPTGTLTPILTNTSTPTDTPTATVTSSFTATPSPTWTSTPGVFQFTVSPKPDAQGQIHFQWGTTIPADEAYLRVFTSGFRLVWEDVFNKDQKPEFLTTDPHDVTWNGRDDQGRPMPPGSYICFISVTVGKKTYESSAKTEIP